MKNEEFDLLFDVKELKKEDIDAIFEVLAVTEDILVKEEYIKQLHKRTGYRISTIEKTIRKVRKNLKPPEEIEEEVPPEMLDLLENENLFNMITEEELDKKIVGEVDTRKTIFLCAQGRLVINCQPSSYNLLINSESGAGKDYIASNTLEMIPRHVYEKKTRISPTAFTYWHSNDPLWTWDGKICYLEDISSGVFNHEVFKVMTSTGSAATIVKEQIAIEMIVNGKPVMITTSASASPNPEMLRRFTILPLDETIDQTHAILLRQAEVATESISPYYNDDLIECQNHLKRIKVKIPFAKKIISIFPKDHIFIRTHFTRFLDYIKASCAFHQYQRSIDEEENYIATPYDYDIARISLMKTTTNKSMIPLTKDQRRLIRVFEEKFGSEWIFIKQIEANVSFVSDKWLRKMLNKLNEYGFLDKAEKEKEELSGKRKNHIAYKFIDFSLGEIPKWDEISEFIKSKESDSLNSLTSPSISVSEKDTIETGEVRVEEEGRVLGENKEDDIYNTLLFYSESPIMINDLINIFSKEFHKEIEDKINKLINDNVLFEVRPGVVKCVE